MPLIIKNKNKKHIFKPTEFNPLNPQFNPQSTKFQTPIHLLHGPYDSSHLFTPKTPHLPSPPTSHSASFKISPIHNNGVCFNFNFHHNLAQTQIPFFILSKTGDHTIQIAGNFSPVPEQPVQHHFPVVGTIPEHIDGVYLQNGANPMFDGDGMIYAVKFNDGSASHAYRFKKTQRLVQERAIGKPVFPKVIRELHGHSDIAKLLLFYARGLCGLVDHSQGIGVANVGWVYFNNRLLAMSEDDLPYEVKITPTGDLKMVGRYKLQWVHCG